MQDERGFVTFISWNQKTERSFRPYKPEERQSSEKPPLGRPRSGTVGSISLVNKKGTAGYHSEGYFSSDQDEEGPKKNDLKSPRTPEAYAELERLNSQDSSKSNSIRKLSTKPEGRTCCKERDRKPSVSEISGKSYKLEKKMGSDSKKQLQNAPTEEYDPSKDDKDDVSEAGTYTIDKDSPSPEEDEARSDINNVFGVPAPAYGVPAPSYAVTAPTESEGEIGSITTAVPMSTTDHCLEDESSWLSASEMQPPTLSRNSPNWIQQWAAQVAEQTKPPLDPMSPRGHKLPVSPPDCNDNRPRRKLPTVPAYLSSSPCGISQRSDPASSGKHRYWEDKINCSDLQTSSIQTSDTEAYLRDTENLVTSLQARVDKTKGNSNPAFRHANNHNTTVSFESHESGADSDTCNSYPFNEDERMSAALRSKLRLTGLLPSSKNTGANTPPGVSSPRRPDCGTSAKRQNDDRKSPRRLTDGGKDSPLKTYDVYNNSPRRDDRCLQSDSSSEASEPYKEVTRQSDNNPPLKFNRAFSLRRARLGCDDPSSRPDKKKQGRPSSAGAAPGPSRRTPALGTSSKSYHSVDNPSVSSPRGHSYGLTSSTTRGLASPSQGGCRATSQTDNFDRSDGGRFSLRLPRTEPSSIGLQKSPSKSSIKKDTKKSPAGRSNSTLSSKEVDFQNWKRRKNYDPMKAAAEGRKKQVDKKIKNIQMSTSQTSSEHRSPSPPGSLLRSASFHGTEGVVANPRWSRKHNNRQHYTSEDDGPFSLEDEMGPHPSPMHGSPLHRSPTSPHQLCQSPIRQAPPTPRGRRPSLGHTEETDPHYQASIRKVSMDETGSEGKRSPLNTGNRASPANPGVGPGSGRPKTKMEALDNLVISTIHSLSVKVRTTSESLLQKLKSQYDEEGDRAALLEEVLSHLGDSDQSLASGQTRSTSRELAGILRNLKKIEHALEVIDRVIIVGEEDYVDDEVDYVPTEWVDESDY